MLSGFFSRRKAAPAQAQVRKSPVSCETLEKRELLSAVALDDKTKVAMLTNVNTGAALNSSRITVKFSENINLVDTSKFRLFGYSINPTSGSGVAQQKTTINITSVSLHPDGNKLIFETDRRVRKGARLIIYDGAITNAAGGTATGELQSLLPKGLNKERFTLACRAFTPKDLIYFNKNEYEAAANLNATPTQPSTGSVTTALTSFLDKKVAAGQIDAAKKTQALNLYNDANVQSMVPSANLRAAIVSLVGTIAEASIDSLLTTNNVTGKKYTVIDFSTEVSGSATVAETKGNPDTGRLRTLFKTSYQGESFVVLSAFMAHESLRQDLVGSTPDLQDGINESIFVNVVNTLVWAQQILIDPSVADNHTQLVTQSNAQLLAMLNSGAALFPRVGIYDAPVLGGQVFPGGDAVAGGAYTSFYNYVRRLYEARGFADVETPMSPLARSIQNTITARNDTAASNFTDAKITLFDNSQQIITDKSAVQLAHVIKSQIFGK